MEEASKLIKRRGRGGLKDDSEANGGISYLQPSRCRRMSCTVPEEHTLIWTRLGHPVLAPGVIATPTPRFARRQKPRPSNQIAFPQDGFHFCRHIWIICGGCAVTRAQNMANIKTCHDVQCGKLQTSRTPASPDDVELAAPTLNDAEKARFSKEGKSMRRVAFRNRTQNTGI